MSGAHPARSDRRRRASGPIGLALVGTAALVVASCGGGGGEDEAGDDEPRDTPVEVTAVEATAAPTSPTTVEATEPPATETTPGTLPPKDWDRGGPSTGGGGTPEAEALDFALTFPLRGGLLPEPDAACLADGLEGLPASARGSLASLVEDPLSWAQIPDDDALVLAQTYLGCAEDQALRATLALTVLGFPTEEMVQCVELAWRGRLTSQNVAASLAHGNGLDDLAPELLEQLVETAVSCGPDRAWWVDELELELDGTFEPEQARCVAAAYVDRLGVETAVARRVLTMPVLTLSPTDREQLDLPGRCGVDHVWPAAGLGAVRGECLAGFGAGTENTTRVDCTGEHNAEVVDAHELDDEFPQWPGMNVLRDHAMRQCAEDADGLPPSRHGAAWDFPNRHSWEAGHRTLTCAIVLPDYEPWVGPTGLIPAPSETTTTTAAPTTTTVVAAPTPAIGEVVDDLDLVAVGQCLFGPGLLDPAQSASVAVTVAACTSPHHAEVFHVSELDGPPGTAYPGDAAIEEQGNARCLFAFNGYVGTDYESSRYYFTFFYPDSKLWNADDRTLICLLHEADDGPMTTPAAGSGQ